MVKIDVSRLYELENKVKTMVLPLIIDKVADELESELKNNSPRKTGKLSLGWRQTKVGNLQVIIENDVEYASFVINGTKAHTITPRSANALSFQMNGNTIFAKRVNHPGTSPNDFVDRSIENVESRLEQIIRSCLSEGGVL